MKPIAESRVLVVEDDPLSQRVLVRRLSAEGYQVFAASDGREGMKAIVTFEPDLVISDWMMPELDGLELCQSVKTGLGEAAPYYPAHRQGRDQRQAARTADRRRRLPGEAVRSR